MVGQDDEAEIRARAAALIVAENERLEAEERERTAARAPVLEELRALKLEADDIAAAIPELVDWYQAHVGGDDDRPFLEISITWRGASRGGYISTVSERRLKIESSVRPNPGGRGVFEIETTRQELANQLKHLIAEWLNEAYPQLQAQVELRAKQRQAKRTRQLGCGVGFVVLALLAGLLAGQCS